MCVEIEKNENASLLLRTEGCEASQAGNKILGVDWCYEKAYALPPKDKGHYNVADLLKTGK